MALAWLFERDKSEQIICAKRALSSRTDTQALVQPLWYTEVANALLVGERHLVVTRTQVTDYLARLSELPITMDKPSPAQHRDQVMALAREYGLTAYDATYLTYRKNKDSEKPGT